MATRTTLNKIWADWEKFASYAFNKSHATCYSWVSYQTAYLKAHFPSEYMAAVLSRSLSNIVEITKYMAECKAMGIQVLGPDVNESNPQVQCQSGRKTYALVWLPSKAWAKQPRRVSRGT